MTLLCCMIHKSILRSKDACKNKVGVKSMSLRFHKGVTAFYLFFWGGDAGGQIEINSDSKVYF